MISEVGGTFAVLMALDYRVPFAVMAIVAWVVVGALRKLDEGRWYNVAGSSLVGTPAIGVSLSTVALQLQTRDVPPAGLPFGVGVVREWWWQPVVFTGCLIFAAVLLRPEDARKYWTDTLNNALFVPLVAFFLVSTMPVMFVGDLQSFAIWALGIAVWGYMSWADKRTGRLNQRAWLEERDAWKQETGE